ncbi:MAG: hypothetical protein CM1200mP29_11710 [Verrucomicrobiota bacterium]|nr:MAG: hypothetical protein CM1200mP29_11710 [Verrucomicrobiota bacterium]
MVSDVQMADFEVEVEVKLPEQSAAKDDHFNSGLGFRLFGETKKPKGYQCEFERESPGKNGGVYGIGWGGGFSERRKQTTAMREKNKGLFRDDKWKNAACELSGRDSNLDQRPVGFRPRRCKSLRGRFGIQHQAPAGWCDSAISARGRLAAGSDAKNFPPLDQTGNFRYRFTMKTTVFIFSLALGLVSTKAAKGLWTNPADPTIPIDFKIQGEYVGKTSGNTKLGAQVIPLWGEVNFRLCSFPAVCPVRVGPKNKSYPKGWV